MAIPTKKMYDGKGKLVFDPNNPEDVRNYKEKQPLLEALKLVQGLTDPRTGGGLTGVTKIISRAAGVKSQFARNKAKKILELLGKKSIAKGKKDVPNTRKQAAPTVKEVVEIKPTIPTNVPTSGSTAPIKKGSTREEMKTFYQKAQKAKNIAKDIVTNKKLKIELEKIREANKPFYEKSIKEAVDASNKKIAIATGIIGGLAAAGGSYYGITSSNKDNKQTKTPQKTGPVDLKRITNTKPSSIPGVSIVKGTDGKDYGIVWDNKTKSWDYYRGDKTKKTPETPKPDVVKKEDVGGGSVTPIKDNQGGGTGGGTKPRSATGQAFDKAFAEARKQAGGAGGIFEWNGKKYGTALVGETVPKDRVEVGKTTTPVMGDEYYKKDPRLATLRQEDDDRQLLARAEAQKKEMMEFKPTKPLSSLVFKTTSESINKRNTMDEQNALQSIRENNKLPLKKKRYGGNLAMLKYMK